MAKASPNFPFPNNIGNYSAYYMKGVKKLIIRAKGRAPKDKIKTAPEFGVMRENSSEFGGCSKSASNIRIFQPEMTAKNELWLSTERALRSALENNEFELHYQPKVDARNLTTLSSEALIRWRQNEKLVSPAQLDAAPRERTLASSRHARSAAKPPSVQRQQAAAI